MKTFPHMKDVLVQRGGDWVLAQRERYRPSSQPLSEEAFLSLSPFFREETLACVGISRIPLIENPPFYTGLQGKVLSLLLDFRKASAITFIDTVVINSNRVGPDPGISLLFHEVVHVVQYRILGVSRFTRQYVLGWAENGYRYRKIPLERQAFELGERFSAGTLRHPAEVEIEKSLLIMPDPGPAKR